METANDIAVMDSEIHQVEEIPINAKTTEIVSEKSEEKEPLSPSDGSTDNTRPLPITTLGPLRTYHSELNDLHLVEKQLEIESNCKIVQVDHHISEKQDSNVHIKIDHDQVTKGITVINIKPVYHCNTKHSKMSSIDPEVSSACSSEEYVTASSETTESCSEVSSLEMVMDVSSLTLSDSAVELEDKSLESEPMSNTDLDTTLINNNNDNNNAEETRKGPGKLFDSDDEDDEADDITLKDYEQKSLQTLALERKRIIENQVVRRKKIDTWTFAEHVDDNSVENKFQRILLQQTRSNGNSVEVSQNENNLQRENKDMHVKEDDKLKMDMKFQPQVKAMAVIEKNEVTTAHESLKKMDEVHSSCTPEASPKPNHVDESFYATASPTAVNDDNQPSSLTSNDSVDCTSILEKKEQLKRYWEQRIMAEQDLISFDVVDSSRSPAKVALSSDVNGNESKESLTINGNVETNEANKPPTMEPKLNGDVPVTSLIDVAESLNDVERQHALKEQTSLLLENTVADDAEESGQQENGNGVLDSTEDESALTDDSLIIHEDNSLDTAPVVKGAVFQTTKEVVIESREEVIEFREEEQTSVDTGTMQEASKPQVIGETYRAAQSVFKSSATTTITNGHANLKSTGSYNSNNAESIIAMEIRELREREEELKQMRERLMMKTTTTEHNHDSVSDSSLKSDSQDAETASGRATPCSDTNGSLKNGQAVAHTISLDSLPAGQNYNLGYAFGHRRKDRITVKPLADQDSDEEKPVFKILNESPIEREIRLAKEREEALRREKGLVGANADAERTQKVDSTPAQKPSALHSNRPKTYSAKVNGETQKVIATVRIQQEIEEQTQRELALKASGSIQTISQERTDSKITRLVDRSPSSDASTPTTPSSAKSMKSPVSTPTGFVPAEIEICEKSSPTTNGHACNGGVPSPSQANGFKASGTNGLSQSSSSTSNSSGTGVPVGRRFIPNPTAGRGISMQKFISSKGKDFVFSTFSKSTVNGASTGITAPVDYYEIKPPQVRKVAADGSGASTIRKGLVPAESKIQEELKEMKAREDELKRQRAKSLNKSQPNLATLHCDEDVKMNGNNADHKDDAEPGLIKERCSSNPNLAKAVEAEVDTDKTRVGGPRRRSTLIAQWEQIIQGTEART